MRWVKCRDILKKLLKVFKKCDYIQRVRACAGWGMQPSELLRCELGEVTSTGETEGETRGHPGRTKGHPGETNKKGSEMGGTRCQEDDPGRGR